MTSLLTPITINTGHDPVEDNESKGLLSSLTSKLVKTAGKYYSQASLGQDSELHAKRLEVAKVLQRHASSYEEWARASQELDFLSGYDDWKMNPVSDEYDFQFIAKRLNELRSVRESGDYLKLLFLIRTTFTRNPGNIGNTKLYLHSHIGTKYLIDDYIGECEEALRTVLNCPIPTGDEGDEVTYIDDYTKLDELLRTRHSFGRTALLLSGGGTMGMLHSGVIEVLLECNLLPKIISGSSAGAIVASALCTRSDAELPALLENFTYFNLDVFEVTGSEESVWTRLARFLKHGAWTDISFLASSMKEILGEMTFQEAYNRTRRVLNIPVSSASVYEPPRLLNYLTAPNVYIWSAVCASCSVPLIFSSHTLLAKDPRTNQPVPWNPSPQRWIDGSVDNDLPMSRLNEMFNVNHFIVSQVNPHVIPFLKSKSAMVSDRVMKLAVSETMHRLLMSSELGILPNLCTKLRSVLAQTYSGDITILPEVYVSELPKILKNPTPKFLLDARLRGQRATWPRISIIRNHCAIELALDAAIIELRSRTFFNAMVVGARKLSFPYSYFQQHQQSFPRWTRRRSYDITGATRRETEPLVGSSASQPHIPGALAPAANIVTPTGGGASVSISTTTGSMSRARAGSRASGQVTIITPNSERAQEHALQNLTEKPYAIAGKGHEDVDEDEDEEEEEEEEEETDRDDAAEDRQVGYECNEINPDDEILDEEDEDDEGGYMMGLFPEDTDFDIGSPVETFHESVAPSASGSPTASPITQRRSRRSSLYQQQQVGTAGSPPKSPYHQRRPSGGNDGYYYNYFNYNQRPPSSSNNRQLSRSQPTTPGHSSLFSRQGSIQNMTSLTSNVGRSNAQYQHLPRLTVGSGAMPSSTTQTHAQSLTSSPRARLRTYSDVPLSLSMTAPATANMNTHLIGPGSSSPRLTMSTMTLPPSLDSDNPEPVSCTAVSLATLPRRPSSGHLRPQNHSTTRRHYWPLQYETASAVIIVPGISSGTALQVSRPVQSTPTSPRLTRSMSSLRHFHGTNSTPTVNAATSSQAPAPVNSGVLAQNGSTPAVKSGHVVDIL
ncbi:acyl transferase/acyl hydrolase/lysophospholipase [Lipomyces tetrasporus]|uniref:Acyl transferase/acyl hydrolase/lysophospholipase n=1 Tax=Lipomyces tetrasporus TaxID=54092 RepID=A0AAD7QWV3_9ASCO|nr:acyl transferase/acyl hydrolase/lysophospholipase [Lipomyces tetrasporus]KAJ8102765.1 acyl transferase/acyl hydrolase/lysophospholipase [Lipomyces tetrasporus]